MAADTIKKRPKWSVIAPDENPDITLWDAIQAAERAWICRKGSVNGTKKEWYVWVNEGESGESGET